LIMA